MDIKRKNNIILNAKIKTQLITINYRMSEINLNLKNVSFDSPKIYTFKIKKKNGTVCNTEKLRLNILLFFFF